eukprot:CAMPEP_0185035536 /NCGR_PEP_ID=MMETSP1103-20130426/27085_1 /TAXON_ID=36769 /ORGANISM="Paraphysomonas bandaiensis, Strain Caron Lab Isolate" /LENGTH=593 /DNA_ID=CAMNT_0027572661 /DNA_START=1 /DNA_END=1782 /DNA_ORIENTATION=+
MLSPERNDTYSPVFNENAPTLLTFDHLTVKTKTRPEKILLNNVSGQITGGFWAIMGASGGGKTTLLSTLSLRLDRKYMDIQGTMHLNGTEYSKKILKAVSAYVMQDDLLHAELTVYETLSYAAQLRLVDMTNAERQTRIEEVMKMMGIEHCRDVIIGDTRRKGISGGERKRVCVAVELLRKPKLLFLDEMTSGLDSSTSLKLCTALKRLSDMGECTVICTIHQPQQKIFELFDNLILMKKGTVFYQGSAFKCIRFMENLGHPLPAGTNPADHFLEVITPREDNAHEGQVLTVPIDLTLGININFYDDNIETSRSWIDQFLILCGRNLQQYIRNRDVIFMNLAVTLLIGTFISQGIWNDIGTDQQSIQTRLPSLFFAAVSQGILASLQSVNSFPGERALILRERANGAYFVSSYFAAKTVTDIITQLWSPIIFTCLVYPEVGYEPVSRKFFIYMMFMILDTFAATSIATAVTCLFVSIERSTIILAGVFEMCRLYGGFFTSPAQLKDYPDWKFADRLSYIKYAYVGIAINELQDLELSCTQDEIDAGSCISSGQTIMDQKGYDQYDISSLAGYLFLYIVVTRIIAYLGLRFIKN